MNNFADRLIHQIQRKKSCIIVGLDPRVELIPRSENRRQKTDAQSIAQTLLRFNKKIIDLVADEVVGVKPQSAFYEKYGYRGVKAWWETLAYAKEKGLITIADVKRGDVPSTAEAYAEAYLGKSERDVIDAITVNPFLGGDSLQPFIKLAQVNGKGLFVLVKTSNLGSKDFQDKTLAEGQRFYEYLAGCVRAWGRDLIGKRGYSSVGAVVGATFPEEAKRLRELMPEQFFLVPGYGAQGGKAADVSVCFKPDGLGALITAARSIIHAYQDPTDKNWEEKVISATRQMNKDVTRKHEK